MGKTLVLALFPSVDSAVPVEDEWKRQLHSRGVEAKTVNMLLPGAHAPNKERVVELLRAGSFDTLLVSRLIDVKKIERDAPARQVATVETKLYDARSGEVFWSVRSDTFLGSAVGEGVREAKSEQLREYVEKIIAEMVKSKLL